MAFRCEFRRINAIFDIVIIWRRAWPLFQSNRIISNFKSVFLSFRNVFSHEKIASILTTSKSLILLDNTKMYQIYISCYQYRKIAFAFTCKTVSANIWNAHIGCFQVICCQGRDQVLELIIGFHLFFA